MILNNNHFLTDLKRNLRGVLPGEKAHDTVMSYPRLSPNAAIETGKNPKQSAVLVLLFPFNNQWHFVLTKRKEYPGIHSKQISLPGGKIEDQDLSLQHTALRETQEEIGVNAGAIKIVGELTSLYIPPSNFIVQPYVGYVDFRPDFIPEEKEVDEIIISPVSRLLDPTVIQTTHVTDNKSRSIEVPYFAINNEVVWGATAMVLSEFREICTYN